MCKRIVFLLYCSQISLFSFGVNPAQENTHNFTEKGHSDGGYVMV